MKAYDILLVEDTPDILERNRSALTEQGYVVAAASSLEQARLLLARRSPDLLVLDVMLPDGSGLDLCRELRERSVAPILFLTSLGESEEIIRGLRAGGDDYITKPYRVEELLARVEAQLRRMEMLQGRHEAPGFGPLTLEHTTQRAFLDGVDLLLKTKECLLLAALLRADGGYLTTEALYNQVWGAQAAGDVRTVVVHLSGLRGKLRTENENAPVRIEHSRSRGYRIVLTGEEDFE